MFCFVLSVLFFYHLDYVPPQELMIIQQKLGMGEVMDFKGEHTTITLLNQHNSKLHSKYLSLQLFERNALLVQFPDTVK